MAIIAIGKGNLGLEIALEMASDACHLDMLPRKRVLRFGVVEIEARKHGPPTAGRVAGFAGFFEFALVRIQVTRGTDIEFHIPVTRRTSRGVWFVAFLARHFGVQTCKGIASLRMVKVFGRFPAFQVVALRAFVAQLLSVRVVVTRLAERRQAEIGLGEIFFLDEGALCGDHVRRGVALLAGNVCVLPFQVVTRLAVVELFL